VAVRVCQGRVSNSGESFYCAVGENRDQERSFLSSCCDGETHVVSERTWPWGILEVLIGSAHPPNDLLSGASSVYFRELRTDEALFYELR
jgi:hypothetical protein